MGNLELVHDVSQAKRDCEIAVSALKNRSADLAANILRIVAGAGKPHEVPDQLNDMLKAYLELLPYAGREYPFNPSAAIMEALRDFDWRDGHPGYPKPSAESMERWSRDGTVEKECHKENMAMWALRLRASQLEANPTQESTSDSKLSEAARNYVAVKHRPY